MKGRDVGALSNVHWQFRVQQVWNGGESDMSAVHTSSGDSEQPHFRLVATSRVWVSLLDRWCAVWLALIMVDSSTLPGADTCSKSRFSPLVFEVMTYVPKGSEAGVS